MKAHIKYFDIGADNSEADIFTRIEQAVAETLLSMLTAFICLSSLFGFLSLISGLFQSGAVLETIRRLIQAITGA